MIKIRKEYGVGKREKEVGEEKIRRKRRVISK